MGIKGLMKMLKHYAPNAIIEVEYASLSGSVVALDILLQLYKFIIAIRGNGDDIKTKDGRMKSHLYGLLCKIHNMLKYGIIPVAVFDGKAPTIKKETLKDRCCRKKNAVKKLKKIQEEEKNNNNKDNNNNKNNNNNKDNNNNNKDNNNNKNNNNNKDNNDSNDTDKSDDTSSCSSTDSMTEKIKFYKRSFNISENHIIDAKKIMEYFGFLNIQAPEEADSQCAALNVSNFVDAVVTEDMDVLAFGTTKMLRKFSNKNKVIEIDFKKILSEMQIDKDQFIDICIILGTDYCKPIKGLNINTLHDIYMKFGNMEDFVKELDSINTKLIAEGKEIKYKIPKNFMVRWKIAKEYYLSSAFVIDPIELINNKIMRKNYWSKPNKNKIIEFLCTDNDFDVAKITRIVDYAIKRYNEYIKKGYIETDWCEINKKKSYNNNKKQKSADFVVLGRPII